MLDEKLVLEKALKNDPATRQSRFRSLASALCDVGKLAR
jgi:hypothetical protein